MRRNYFLIGLIVLSLVSNQSFGQIYLKNEHKLADSLSYRENFDHFIKNLDKGKFKSGILYDRVVPFAKLHNYNPENPLDTSSYKHFIQAYYEIYLASFDNKNMKTFKEVKSKVKETAGIGVIPIGILNYEFNYIDSLVLKDSGLIIKNKQLDKSPNSQKPHVKKTKAYVAAILSSKLTTGENTFSLNDTFIFTNINVKIESLELDLGNDMGSFSINPDETIKVNLNKPGILLITYTLHLKNGKKLKGYSQIEVQDTEAVKLVVPKIKNCGHEQVESDPYTDPDGVSKKGIADMYFYYSDCNNPILQKPIIIFDGFDPGDTREEYEIYDLMNDEFPLADKLRSKGYDVVIVNFPVGADFMERNAYAAIEVIKWVNENKTTNNKIVIVGPSMGGVISRFALAKMEKDGEDHQTGLWISFDAPHQGANIPIGDQWFLRFFGYSANNAGAMEGLDKINSPAARQLLVHHYSRNSEKPEADWDRISFRIKQSMNGLLGSNGYPQNLRKIALINGSDISEEQEGIDNTTYLLTMTGIGLSAKAWVKSSADLGWHRWVFDGWYLNINATQRWTLPGDSPYFNISYDKAPGGFYKTQSILAEGENWSAGFTVYYPGHCFIPSVSALDLKYPYLKMNIRNRDVVGNNETPFDDYYAPDTNQEHITFSAASVNWLESELGTNWEISGDGLLCNYANRTYSITNLPESGATIQWSNSSDLEYVSGQGTSNYVVKAKNSIIGKGFIRAVVTNGGDRETGRKSPPKLAPKPLKPRRKKSRN